MTAKPHKDAIPPLEWASAALGALIALALMFAIGRAALVGNADAVPVLESRVLGVHRTAAGYVVEFEVANAASRTAAAVQVEGESGGETRTAVLDYVPGRSRTEGGLVFQQPPRGLQLRVTGYEVP